MQQVSSRSGERAATARRRGVQMGQVVTIVGFLLPATIIYVGLVLLPVVQAIYYSFFRWNGLGPLQNFIGLTNYIRILSDRVFVGALGHNVQIVALSLLIQLPLALALALLVGRNLRGRSAFRTIFFMPFVLSEVVTGVIWNFIYLPDGGLV